MKLQNRSRDINNLIYVIPATGTYVSKKLIPTFAYNL